MMDYRLKACPFCGSEEMVRLHSWENRRDGEMSYRCTCDRCGGTTKPYGDEQRAIRAWNERTLPPEPVVDVAEEIDVDAAIEALDELPDPALIMPDEKPKKKRVVRAKAAAPDAEKG